MTDGLTGVNDYSWTDLPGEGVRMFAAIDPQEPTGYSFIAFKGRERIFSQRANSEEHAKQLAEQWATVTFKLKLDEPLGWIRVRFGKRIV
jgi:hypothetical protein